MSVLTPGESEAKPREFVQISLAMSRLGFLWDDCDCFWEKAITVQCINYFLVIIAKSFY
jgi:hypothetical protein